MNIHINRILSHLTSGIFLLLLPTLVQGQTITSISPVAASVGTNITINGTGLIYKTLPTAVFFGSIPATVVSQSASVITATVPAGATYDRISVVVSPTGTAVSEQFFMVQTGSPCAFKTPVFDAPVAIATAPTVPVFIELADMNGDGKEDLLVLSSDSKTNVLTIFTNTSKGFENTYQQSLSAVPVSLAVGNLNTDGFMDIVIGYASGNMISIIPGSTGTTFGTLQNVTVGIKNVVVPRYIAINDLNGDKILDIITGNRNAAEGISILTKSSISGFDYATSSAIATTKSVTSIDIGDLNTDGKKDIITAEGMGYYYSGVDGYNKPIQLSSVSTNPVAAGDYDKDGKTDIVLGYEAILGTYSEANGNRQSSSKAFPGNPLSFAGADYNSDGNADVAAVFADTKSNYIAFFENDGSGDLQFQKNYITTGFTGKAGLATGDADQDGQADLVTFDPNKNVIYLYRKSSSVIIDPSSISATSPCKSNPATVTAQTSEGTIQWYTDASASVLIATGTSVQIPASYLPASTSTIYVRGTNGKCIPQPQPLTITVKPNPSIKISSSSTPVCPGTAVTVTASGDAASYAWTPASDVASPASAATSITPLNAVPVQDLKNFINTYTYTVTGTTNGCSTTATAVVNVRFNQTAITTNREKDKNYICSGDSVSFVVNSTPLFDNGGFTWTTDPKIYKTPDVVPPMNINPVNPGDKDIAVTYSINGLINTCPVTVSKTITIKPAQKMTPTSLPLGMVGNPYGVKDFSVTDGVAPDFKLALTPSNSTSVIPPGLGFDGNMLTGTPKKAGSYTFNIITNETGKCPASVNYTLRIEDLAEPNLVVFPVYANAGDPAFFIKPSNTLSNGALQYTIKTGVTSSCAQLGPNGYVSMINCTDSIPVIVTQAQTIKYKAASIETYIKISPNPATKVVLTTTGVILTDGQSQLNYATNSDAPKKNIEFVQLNNTDVAEIKSDGTIIPYKTGTVEVEIRVPATSQYEAITRTATITVYGAIQKPVITNDTIIITVDQDTIFNILANDQGITRAIAPAQTDIDLENPGVQNKYYSIGVGNFLIDLNGNVEFTPFGGFIGNGKIGYTVTDSAGVKSDVGYIYVEVVPLKLTPPLKANEVMTPNNDGANDGLVIAYAYLDANNSLTVLDEAGNVVYETTNYQNDWRGTDKKGNAIEPGIYFYVYEEKVSGRGLQQYIQILK